ncbi:thermonuclease family protein [Ensifer soli]|uniref:thermonuclease family protein n=1 Tax=Ciceribacter sp. sgz301302 TaxID=3342379 RepID=UPI0035BB81E9
MRGQMFLSAGHGVAILAFLGLLAAGSVRIGAREADPSTTFVLETPDGDGAEVDPPGTPSEDPMPFDAGTMPPATDEAVESAPLREVPADPGVDARDGTPLERVAPRPAASGTQGEAPAKPVLLARPVPLNAGLIAFDHSRRLQLDGIEPQDAARRCGADEWPCGALGRTAFRNFLRGRSIACDVPSATWEETVTARCTVAGQDLAEWLVRNGWAEAGPGSAFAEAGDDARAAGLGIFGTDPRRRPVQPSPLPPIMPEDGATDTL